MKFALPTYAKYDEPRRLFVLNASWPRLLGEFSRIESLKLESWRDGKPVAGSFAISRPSLIAAVLR